MYDRQYLGPKVQAGTMGSQDPWVVAVVVDKDAQTRHQGAQGRALVLPLLLLLLRTRRPSRGGMGRSRSTWGLLQRRRLKRGRLQSRPHLVQAAWGRC